MQNKNYFLLFVLLCTIFFCTHFVHAAPPSGFTNQLLASNLNLPTDFAYAPDARIFITLKNGQVVIFKNGAVLPTPALSFTNVQAGISTGGDRGLLSVALDPNFSQNGYLYLAYTTAANHERISRFTTSGDTINPASELVLIENPDTWTGFLNAVTLRYNGTDGKLYASVGSNGLSNNSQDLGSLDGKLLRLNLDGSIPTDNPFTAIQGAKGAIWSYGLRNPWKMNIEPSGTALIGDVGENNYEKIVRSAKGANFGWPTFEGDCTPNCNGITPPLYVYPHNGNGAAVVGGDIYRGTGFPTQYRNNYFYGDYVQGYINMLTLGTSGNVTATSTFDSGLGSIATVNSFPDGCLYYAVIFPGELHRYCYAIQPVLHASVSATPTYGSLPLAVNFSSAGSTDSSGTALNFSWNFGDNTTGTGATTSHSYTQKGIYTATLTASNANGSSTATTKIWAGYLPPTPHITAPLNGAKYSDGDTINFSGNATDPQDGNLGANSLSWLVTFHHNTHIHSPTTYASTTSGSFTVPNNDEPSPVTWYEIDLTATNSAGLASTTALNIYPNVTTTHYLSNPSGAQILLDSQPITTPYDDQSVAGFVHSLSVNSPQTIATTSYNFASWSQGGAQTQTYTTPLATTTITANFTQNTGGGGTTGTFTSSASLDAATYNPNQALFINTSVTDTANLTNALTDVEIYNSSGTKVAQNTTPTNFTAGQASNLSWNTTAPNATGTYSVKIGVFASDWSKAYYWNDNAASFNVGTGTPPPPPPPNTPPTVTDSVSLNGTSFPPNSTTTLTTTATSDQTVTVNLDTEIYGSSGKVLQQNKVVTLTANQPLNSAWNLTTPSATGTYSIKVGIFSNDWSKLYKWDDNAGVLQVGSSTPPPPPQNLTFIVSASMPKSTFNPSEQSTLTTNVTATGDVPNVAIDTEVYDSSGTKVAQKVVNTSLTANQQSSNAWNLAVPATNGAYVVKVGVFSGDWSKAYYWNNAAFKFNVGTPPGGPQPGVTYTINVITPKNNATVSGVTEVQAVINGLDINTYNIGWRTGGGQYFNLDTEPYTQTYKHAWIDFSAWNWNANNVYPLEWQATDQSGNVIGHQLNSVTVQH